MVMKIMLGLDQIGSRSIKVSLGYHDASPGQTCGMKPNLVRSQGTRFDQTLDLISGCHRIADREIQQRLFFYELCTREIDACFVICTSCSLVVFIGFVILAPLAVKISVSLECVASRRYEVKKLTSLKSLIQVRFARRKVPKVEVTEPG